MTFDAKSYIDSWKGFREGSHLALVAVDHAHQYGWYEWVGAVGDGLQQENKSARPLDNRLGSVRR